MYNAHRGMVPAPNSRLTELLDQLRQEFESQSRNTGEFEHQCMSPVPFNISLPSFYAQGICALSFPLSNHFIQAAASSFSQ
mgnify:FL=1|jgi:hypothetical protein